MSLPRRASIRLVILSVCFCLTSAASADRQSADARLALLRETLAYPGISAAVAVDGEIVWSGAAGYADVEAQTASTPGTVYRLGSVSKVVTAAAVALLVQSGKLDLDAPVQRYVPEFPEKELGPITTRLLAGHLSGLPHYGIPDTPDTRRPNYDNVIDAMAEYKDRRQLSAPGAQFRYSTYGWSLISAVVERAAGEPFPTYLHRAVFTPLHMNSTRVERAGETVPSLTHFYQTADNGVPEPLPAMFVSYKWAGGGMLSNVEDLVRFGSAWLPGSTMFSEETMQLVFTSQATSDGEATGTGIGWRIDTDPAGRTVYHHGGAIAGGRAFVLIRPGDRAVAAILGNQLGKNNFDLPDANLLIDLVLE
jgi:CubicO group peptidase (beta-lactamase class C family)